MYGARPTCPSIRGPAVPDAWLAPERADLAAQRILDVAEELFVTQGIPAVTMRALADAAGCSRATLYRHFPGKAEVLAAYVDRAASTLAAEVATATRHITEPGDRIVAAMVAAVAGVRANPALIAWFTPETAGGSADLALLSPIIEADAEAILSATLPDVGADDLRERARWMVRVIVSLLTTPGESPEHERAMLTRFVVPVVLGG